MHRWSNWSGRVEASPADVVRVADEADVVAAVERAAAAGRTLRVQGTGHSHAPLVATDGVVIETDGLSGVVAVDRERMEARLRGGTKIWQLGEPLRREGVALLNQGDIDRQAIAGAAATGTHGTGVSLQSFSAAVRGARIVLADGSVVECDAGHEPETWQAARLSLGALGVVTELRLAVRDAYKLEEKMWLEELDAILERIDELTSATRHFEFFWLPGRTRAACKALDETDADPEYPLAGEGARLAWSYDVLANTREDRHTEMEYSVPAAAGPACLRAIRDRVDRDFPELTWPIEYRTVAADDVWLSTAYGRPTVTISVHQGIEHDDEALFRSCEEVFLAFDGRPHWGKVHHLDGEQLAAMHPRWEDWWRVRDRLDPEGRFLNEALRAVRPG
jgi:FAD/FMN-containing dehydrogenase